MNHTTKKSKSLLALLLSGTMVLSLWTPASVEAAEPNTPKEEVVYINLNADGSVQEINVVNIFELDKEGRIIDYGEYQSLRNMTTTDSLEYSDDTVTIDAEAGKLYYEGKLDSNVMPWKVDIHYYMDGKEYTGEEIAGMSGALKITISITENTSCKGGFFDNYALQASLALDTDTCSNIEAPDATVANVGSDKQMTYTILPGEGAEIEITADVTDFEMNGVAVNGIPLNLDVEIEDEELMDQITELLEAIEKLDDGAGELADGVTELQEGAQKDLQGGVSDLRDGSKQLYNGTSNLKDGGSSLQSGTADLKNGAESLDKDIQSLNAGIVQIQKALNNLNAQSSSLTGGSKEFKKALVKLKTALDGVSVTSEDLSALTGASSGIRTGINNMVCGAAGLQSSMSDISSSIESVKSRNDSVISDLKTVKEGLEDEDAKNSLASAISRLKENSTTISQTKTKSEAASQGLSALAAGAQTLQTNYAAFDGKISELANNLGNMAYQMSELSAAVNTLVSEYEKIDNGITAYTGGVAQIVAGYSQVSEGAAQLAAGSSTLVNGSKSLYSGTNELLSGIVEIYDGAGTLYNGTGKLDEGVAKLLTGIAQLYDGSGKLKDGTAAMREETEGMDTQITDKVDELLESITGGDMEITSFVSKKNTDIESVQFVVQTDGILIEEVEQTEKEETEDSNIWQKFLGLFGAD